MVGEEKMKRKISILVSKLFLLIISATLSIPGSAWAQSERTVGLISRDVRASEGYTLFRPIGVPPGGPVYLINNAGNYIHKWTKPLPTRPGGEVFLRENGELVLTTDTGAYALDWDSNLVWEINVNDEDSPAKWFGHHECVELPNGNLLLPGFIDLTAEQAREIGFDVDGTTDCPGAPPLSSTDLLRVDNIWELAPTDPDCGFACGWEVVWRWNALDHITDVTTTPNKIDITYDDPAQGICGHWIQGAWTFVRFNALGYNPERKEIITSASLMNEIWVIAHNTTTEDAKGPDGDLQYRWGNPYAYGAGAPFVNPDNRGDQELSFQHRVVWIEPGLPGARNILIFNNGTDWGNSSVLEVKLPKEYKMPASGEPFKPVELVWQYDEYDTPGSFFAPFISSSQRLPNGNTLINNGPAGYFFEVASNGDKVWEYINPNTGAAQGGAAFFVYRAWRYTTDFPGLASQDLTPQDPLEKYPNTYYVDIKPGSCENPVNRKSNGVLPVAILGETDLDVTTIDPSSILLEGFPPASWSIEDVSAFGECDGRDGYLDLVLKWDSDLVKVALGNASKGDEFLSRMTGYSSDGWFLGREGVSIVK